MPDEDNLLMAVPHDGTPASLISWLSLHYSAGAESFAAAANLLSMEVMVEIAAVLGMDVPGDAAEARMRLALWDHFRDEEVGMPRETALLAVMWDATNNLRKRLGLGVGLAVGPGFDIIARVNEQVERKRSADAALGRDIDHAVECYRGMEFGQTGDAPHSFCYLVDMKPSGAPDGIRAHVSVLGIMTHGVFDRPVSVVARHIGRTARYTGPRRLKHAGEAAESMVREWHAENGGGALAVEIYRDLRRAVISLASGHGRGSWTLDRDSKAETKVRISWDGPYQVVDGRLVFDLANSRIYLREIDEVPEGAIPLRRAGGARMAV